MDFLRGLRKCTPKATNCKKFVASSLALEAKTAYLQSREMLKKIPVNRKKLVFEQEDSLLDENNLKG